MKKISKDQEKLMTDSMIIGIIIAIPIAIVFGKALFGSIGLTLAFFIPLGIAGGLLYSDLKKKK